MSMCCFIDTELIRGARPGLIAQSSRNHPRIPANFEPRRPGEHGVRAGVAFGSSLGKVRGLSSPLLPAAASKAVARYMNSRFLT